ncbi:MAG: DUF1778 domain-containing protein [Vicinamibacterales bacterium]
MASTTRKDNARLNFRLAGELKQSIEQAAAELGQTVSEFAVSTLVREARDVIEQSRQTRLSNRDRDLFIKLLDEADARPNEALKAAARKYRKQLG